MRTFSTLRAIAAAIPEANINTDKILPARYLKTIKRGGLGNALFASLRFDNDGREHPGFVLNREPWRSAAILIALDNFGCGSSREHAAWALADFGIRVIIAPSFAEIFQNNCYKNGILPITLNRPVIDQLIMDSQHPDTASLKVNLPEQSLVRASGQKICFEIAPEKKERLQFGVDEITATERHLPAILSFERSATYCRPVIPTDLGNVR